jgi:hypothetical protein
LAVAPINRAVFEAADAVEASFFQEVEKHLEIVFRFAWEADDKGRTQGEFGAELRHCLMRASWRSAEPGRFIIFENTRAGVLQRNIEIETICLPPSAGSHHQRAGMDRRSAGAPRYRASPALRTGCLVWFDRHTVIETTAMFNINTVGGGVLRDHQQLFDASVGQALASASTSPIGRLTRSPRVTDDAEGAAMVAAFRNF